jgi:4-hydroxy-2-oxoheptanedioate aldolase
MEMRRSKVLEKLRAGKVVSCTKLNLGDPRAAEIAAMCGFDCVWPDTEHVPSDWHTLENQIRAAKMHDVDTLVRVSRGSYSDYVVPLEMDASGIMVPHVMSAADAKDVVWKTRFHPVGRRPMDGGNADGKYCMIDLEDYLKQANDQRFVVIQIEDPEPMDELEEIARIKGIDMLFFGAGDFSHGIGAPGQWDHPEVLAAQKRVAQVSRENGKFAGTPGSIENMDHLIELGYTFISIGADVTALSSYYKKINDAFKNQVAVQRGKITSIPSKTQKKPTILAP